MATTITPGVVTNVGRNGLVTQTPVQVTNTTGGLYGGYGSAVGIGHGHLHGQAHLIGRGAGAVTQTPAMVTNVGINGLVTQTPAVVTDTTGVGIGGYGGIGVSGVGITGVGVGGVTVIPPPPVPATLSHYEYVPVQNSITEYETRQWVETIPRQATVTEYQERRWAETVPREVSRIDHYAIEHVREYIPEVVATSSMAVIPQERFIQRTEFYPVERQVNHGMQGMQQIGGVIGVGAACNHQVVSVGVTQGETIVTAGAPLPPQIVGYTQGVATTGVSAIGGISGVGIGAYPTTIGGGVIGGGVIGGGVIGGHGLYGGVTQTPGVVTNTDQFGNITQTPVVVTNRA